MTERHADEQPSIMRADPWSVGPWLGWLTIIAVFVAIATDRAGEHRTEIVVLASVGAAANLMALLIPVEYRTVESPVGRWLLDAWCAGVIGFGVALVVVGGGDSDFDWVFVLSIPFIAMANRGWRRVTWLTVGLTAFLVALVSVHESYPASGIAFRMVVVAAAAVLVIVMSVAIAHEAEARSEAATRAQLEGLLVAEAHHRVKNSLQQVAELLVLSRPDASAGDAFDDTAARIRSIAAVHSVLQSTEGTDAPADAVVRQVVSGIDPRIDVVTEPVRVSAATAQQLGIVANELVANAIRHGAPPVSVALAAGPPLRLDVTDHGPGYDPGSARLGLLLVRQIVEQGLRGSLQVIPRGPDGTVTRVEFTVPEEAGA